MALKFSKRIKVMKGVHLNLSKSGVSTTVGGRGASVNVGKEGVHANAGIAGTGLSMRTKIAGGKSAQKDAKPPAENLTSNSSNVWLKVAIVGLVVVGVVAWLS